MAFRAASAVVLLNGSGNLTLDKPAGTASGDLMLALIVPNTDNLNETPPSGWTKIEERTGAGYVPGPTIYWKQAGGSEPSTYDWACTGVFKGVILSYDNADGTTPINAHSSASGGGATTSFVAPSVTTTVDGCTLVCFFVELDFTGAGPYTPPSGMTERVDVVEDGTSRADFEIADVLLGTAGATGTKTATATNSKNYWGASVAIAPSTGGGGGSGFGSLLASQRNRLVIT
jgi:hypothetical protein